MVLFRKCEYFLRVYVGCIPFLLLNTDGFDRDELTEHAVRSEFDMNPFVTSFFNQEIEPMKWIL